MKFCFLIVFLLAATAEARWATMKEAPLIYKKVHRETSVSPDGSNLEKWSWILRVQKDNAKENVGTRSIRFYKGLEEVKILRAGTRNGKKWTPVSAGDIQERAVSDENPGFSSLAEQVLSFPEVGEGSELEFDYEVKTPRALEKDFWGQSYPLESGMYENFRWVIHSKRPLFHEMQDPLKVMEIKKSQDGKTLTFSSRKSFSYVILEENEPSLSVEKQIILVASLLKDWKEYGVHSAAGFEKQASGNLLPADEKWVRELASSKKNPETKMELVLRRVTSSLRYFGDWRTSEQMYVPRSLAEINRTQYGDCKDFALLATKYLRRAGLSAQPVWILNSEENPGEFIYKIPNDNAFNHVIVRVKEGEKIWWIDPTNPASRSFYMADEVAGRFGLVLNENGSELQFIRRIEAKDYESQMDVDVLSHDADATKIRVRTRYENFSPIGAGEQVRSAGMTSYLEEHLQRVMPAASLSEIQLEAMEYDETSTELHAFKAIATFQNFWVQTNQGLGFSPIRDDVIERFRNLRLQDRVGDFQLGKVYSHLEVFNFKAFALNGGAKMDCSVQSPWFDFSQTIREVGSRNLVYESRFDLKKTEMVLTAMTMPAIKKLQKEIRSCAGRQLILVRPL